MMATANGQTQEASWDTSVLRKLLALNATQAVICTDTNGRIVHSELRQKIPPGLGEKLDSLLAAQSRMGEHLALGKLRISTLLYSQGTLVCGRGKDHSVVVVSSDGANLGQLISQVRQVFPEGNDP